MVILAIGFISLLKKINLFYFFSVSIVFFFSTVSFLYPRFNFAFMIFFTTIVTILTLPYEIFTGFSQKQQYYLNNLLLFLDKTLVLDFLSVVYVKFFCVPTRQFHKRLFIIFVISVSYIVSSRLIFIKTISNDIHLESFQLIFFYLLLFFGISIIYLRLIISASIFFVSASLRINPSLLSPSILFVLGEDDQGLPSKLGDSKQPITHDRKFSFINVSLTRNYYRQFFNPSNTGNFRLLGYGIALCGSAAAVGTLYYSKIQADAAVIQAEQSKLQSYHTAREADIAAVDAGIITKETYYQRHPEDKPINNS